MAINLRDHWITSHVATATFAILITLATGEVAGHQLSIVIFATILAGYAVIYRLVPHSRLFNLAMTNGLVIYACLFVFFVSANFADVPDWALMIGMPMPVIGFIGGTWVHRADIETTIRNRQAVGGRQVPKFWRWLSPIALIGVATFFTNTVAMAPLLHAAAMLAAMTGIAAIAAWLARDIAVFLIDTGLIFESFWRGLTFVTAPAFAFITFYMFNVIVFAALYRLIDRYSLASHFRIDGVARDMTFAECLYFSVVTLSTVGYGDIVPASDSARLIVSLQVVLGAVLVLIGVSEILNYARNRGSGPHGGDRG
ncbi:MAG: potassium channel family protein [Alphaproteobacteria bacterium]